MDDLWKQHWGNYPENSWVQARHALVHMRTPAFLDAELEIGLNNAMEQVLPRFIELLFRLPAEGRVDITGSEVDMIEIADVLRWLVMTDVDAIQSYLFASIRLATIAGASQIVAENDQQVAQVAQRLGGRALFSAGGAAVVLLPGETDAVARDFMRQAAGAFKQASVGGHLSTSEPVDLRKYPAFDAARTAAATSLEGRKRSGHIIGEAALHPMARQCDACGNEGATALHGVGDDTYWLGPACAAKRNARDRSWLTLLRQQPMWSGLRFEHLADDFSQLAGDDYLAVIVADVNGVGVRLRDLRSPEEYTSFSTGLIEAVKSALAQALLHAVSLRAAPRHAEIFAKTAKLSVQVLFHGGDDIVAACRGRLALPFVRKLTEIFAAQANGPWTGGAPLGMSVGLVLTHPKFPFRTAHHLADRLLAEAKRTAREEGWIHGAVDFAIVSESHATAQAMLGDRVIEAGGASLCLTGRPLHAASGGPRSLGALADACERLAHGFPRNKLFDLRQLCSASYWQPAANAGQVRERVTGLQEAIESWLARVQRQPGTAALWDDVLATLELGENGFYPSDGSTWRTPLGDLADAIGLWGT